MRKDGPPPVEPPQGEDRGRRLEGRGWGRLAHDAAGTHAKVTTVAARRTESARVSWVDLGDGAVRAGEFMPRTYAAAPPSERTTR